MLTRLQKERKFVLVRERRRREVKRNLYEFTRFTKPNFRENWFHEKYYAKLDQFASGEIKKLMVFVPPQHGKSEGSTRRLPAKMIGDNPNLKIGIASYASSKARKFGREIKRVIASPEYKELYPEIQVSAPGKRNGFQNAANEFELPGYEGSIKLDGYTGAWTGDPIDVFILDDLYKSRKEALSPAINSGVIDFYNSVAEARLHNDSQVLIVFTRWAETDLAGYLMEHEREEWQVVVYPALKVGPPTPDDPRENGEPLLPFRHSKEKLQKTQKRDPTVFGSVYQQDPKPQAGLLFPSLKLYDPNVIDVRKLTEISYMQIDPADEGADFYAAPVFCLIKDAVYIPDVIFTKEGTEITEPDTVALAVKHRISYAQFEANGGWGTLGKSIRAKLETPLPDAELRMIKNTVNKGVRIDAQAAFIRRCFYFRQEYAEHEQYNAFMKNLMGYLKEGKNANDDAADVVAGAAKWFDDNYKHLFD